MDEPFVTLFHGTTLASARNIVNHGACRRLYVTTDVQLAADYAHYRASEESSDRAVVTFEIPRALFEHWNTTGAVHQTAILQPFGCYVLYEPTWQYLHNLTARVWEFSTNDSVVLHVAA